MKTLENTKSVNWSLAQVWNSLTMKSDRPLQKRNYCYASEIGGPFIDRILKMRAVDPTNPPNDRSRRKFLAGNIFEYMVKQILITAGVYESDEIKLDAAPYVDTLEVHGRADFKTVNGQIDVELALAHLGLITLPDEIKRIGIGIIESLKGISLKEKILELKSVSTFAMDKVERTNFPIYRHTLQAYHYQRNGGIDADICYCCRDDLRMKQFDIKKDYAEPLYRSDLEQITYHFGKKKLPPQEPLATFDEIQGRFSKNLGVEYSQYLTMVYGFKTPDDYRAAVSFVDKWNRALARYVLVETGQKTPTGKAIVITPKNAEIKAEIIKAKYDWNKIIECKIACGVESETEE